MTYIILRLLLNLGHLALCIIICKFYIIDHMHELTDEELQDRIFNVCRAICIIYVAIGILVLTFRRR